MGFKETSVIKGEKPDGSFENIKLEIGDRLKVDNLEVKELLAAQLVELKLISLKLDSLQRDVITEEDLEK